MPVDAAGLEPRVSGLTVPRVGLDDASVPPVSVPPATTPGAPDRLPPVQDLSGNGRPVGTSMTAGLSPDSAGAVAPPTRDPVPRFVEELGQALVAARQSAGPGVVPKAGLTKLAAVVADFAARAARERAILVAAGGSAEVVLAQSQRLGEALRAQRDQTHGAGDPVTALGLDVLAIIVEYAIQPPVPAALVEPGGASSSRQKIEGWLLLAAEARRNSGESFGDWLLPYVQGTTPVTRDKEVLAGIDRFMRGIVGEPGAARAVYYEFERTAFAGTTAAPRDPSRGPVKVITMGQSAGGPAAVALADKLSKVGQFDVERMILIDPVLVFRTIPDVPADADTWSLYLGPSLFSLGPGWARWHPDGAPNRSAIKIEDTDHFAELAVLFDQGFLQMLVAQAMFRANGASPR